MNWKEAYKDQWAIGNAREAAVCAAIKAATGREAAYVGFGAGSTRYIAGSARANGFDKGGADLAIPGTNVQVEVTGTDKRISPYADIWLRADKIENAARNPDKSIWLVHVIDSLRLMRVIHLNADFVRQYRAGAYREKPVMVRGNQEHFVVIPALDPRLKALSALTSIL